ncbi:MAG TPA: hypothetical protein VK609_07345 [Mucilaginibacter sp.]|nr:hypothetical protein [Mucilaginibacter sp.]
MQQINFCLVSGPNIEAAMSEAPAALQAITKGKYFQISAMFALPELLQPSIGALNRQPVYRVTIVMCLAWDPGELNQTATSTSDMPGMDDANKKSFESLKYVTDALREAGIIGKVQTTEPK